MSITLTPEQRLFARNSFGPMKDASGNLVEMSNTEKELLYAKNLARMNALKRRGEM